MDKINPDHYKNQTSLECIEAMEIVFGDDAVLGFCICNAFKYIWRWKNKNGNEDLDKARWYIERAKRYGHDFKNSVWYHGLDRYIKENLRDEGYQE